MYYMLEQKSMKEGLLLKVTPLLLACVIMLTLVSTRNSGKNMTLPYLAPLVLSFFAACMVLAQTIPSAIHPFTTNATLFLAIASAVSSLYLFVQSSQTSLSPSSVLGGLIVSLLLLGILTRGRAIAAGATSMATHT